MPRAYIEVGTGGPGPSADFRERILLNRDGSDHTRLRTLMGKAFSAPLVRKMRDHIGDLTDSLLVPLLDGEPFDVAADLAYPLPAMVICELLGITEVDRDTVRLHADDAVSADNDRSDRGLMWLREYLDAVLVERRADPDGDLLQRMLAAEEGDDALTHDEIIDNAVLLFVAGFETTRHLITSGCDALLSAPREQARLWADPTLSTTAVEEFLRYDGPVPFVAVVTTEPIEIGDRVVKEARVLALMLQSANHDPSAFLSPDVLDIGRKPNPHVAFGGGVHHCLGAMLARVEGEVVFRRLAERTAAIERAGEPERITTAQLGTFSRLPVRAHPR
jgi:cytochrome P450